jgi:hypothetical protein
LNRFWLVDDDTTRRASRVPFRIATAMLVILVAACSTIWGRAWYRAACAHAAVVPGMAWTDALIAVESETDENQLLADCFTGPAIAFRGYAILRFDEVQRFATREQWVAGLRSQPAKPPCHSISVRSGSFFGFTFSLNSDGTVGTITSLAPISK